jgi:valyl-tRNA synthetase
MLICAPYPEDCRERENENIASKFKALQDVIRLTRQLRSECGIAPETKLTIALQINSGSAAEICKEKTDLIKLLAGVGTVNFVSEKPEKSIGTPGEGFESFIILDGAVDTAALKARFQKEYQTESAFIAKIEAKLQGKFATNAPKEVVQSEREKLEKNKLLVAKLKSYIESL